MKKMFALCTLLLGFVILTGADDGSAGECRRIDPCVLGHEVQEGVHLRIEAETEDWIGCHGVRTPYKDMYISLYAWHEMTVVSNKIVDFR